MACKQCNEFLPCSVGKIIVRAIIDGLEAVLLCLCVYVRSLLTRFFFCFLGSFLMIWLLLWCHQRQLTHDLMKFPLLTSTITWSLFLSYTVNTRTHPSAFEKQTYKKQLNFLKPKEKCERRNKCHCSLNGIILSNLVVYICVCVQWQV